MFATQPRFVFSRGFVGAALVCGYFLFGTAGAASAAVFTSDFDGVANRFPVPNGKYESQNSTTYSLLPTVPEVLNMTMIGPPGQSDTIPLPTPPTDYPIVVNPPLTFEVEGRFGLNDLPKTFARLPDDRYRLYLVEEGGDRLVLDFVIEQGRPVDAEEVPEKDAKIVEGQLDDGTQVEIRESLTLPSQGEHTVEQMPDGTYQIESYFEVWTEISLDGGTTYFPADAPIRLELTQIIPEPSTFASLLCAALFALRCRRIKA